MRRLLVAVVALSATCGAANAQAPYKPGPENVALPASYASKFVRFAMIDKPERKIIRFLYVNAEALEAAKAGAPLPNGTVIVMEDHAARLGADQQPILDLHGRFIPMPEILAIAVQEKRAGWGVGYPAEIRNGEWEYARFNADGSRNPGALTNCFTCHLEKRASQDFAFDYWDFVQKLKK